MKLLGERNWWAPAPLRRFHDRYGLREAPSSPVTPAFAGTAARADADSASVSR
jgi:RND superfamily putative drug exporter